MAIKNIALTPEQMQYHIVKNHVMMCEQAWGKKDSRMKVQYAKLQQAETELLAWGTPQIENAPEKREDLIKLIMDIPVKR